MQQAVLIAAIIAAYVEAGIWYFQTVEGKAGGSPLPANASNPADHTVYTTANLMIVAIWPVLFIIPRVISFLEGD
ncbi:MAG: hypothetical protein ICV68_16990 [Pyrinomonadaceae bacterium]|nr:hypothetical protein [Pyrinomonadaceae bacterium]